MFGIPPHRRGGVFVAVSMEWACYEAIRLLYVPSPLVFVYLSGIYKSCFDDTGWVSMVDCTENLLMTLGLFPAFREGHMKHTCGYAKFYCHHRGFIVTFLTGVFPCLESCWVVCYHPKGYLRSRP